jgi:hypothetical protein
VYAAQPDDAGQLVAATHLIALLTEVAGEIAAGTAGA